MKKIKRNITNNETVIIDDAEFEDCIFIDCAIEWSGGEYSFKNVRFLGNTSFKTKSKEVADSISLMKMLGFLSNEFGDSWTREVTV